MGYLWFFVEIIPDLRRRQRKMRIAVRAESGGCHCTKNVRYDLTRLAIVYSLFMAITMDKC